MNDTASLAGLIACGLTALWFVALLLRKKRVVATETAPQEEPEAPRCLGCDTAEATRPLPKLNRIAPSGIRGWLFKGVPTLLYERFTASLDFDYAVDSKMLQVCDSCGHMTDAMLDTFIAERIDAPRIRADEAIARDAAHFERDGLLDALRVANVKEGSAPPVSAAGLRGTAQKLRAVNGG